MKRVNYFLFVLFFLVPAALLAQTINYSDYDREDNRDINFEIIGKMNNKILVYKNVRWKHKISVYDDEMKNTETIKIDFIPEKTFNIDFIIYPDFFYMIYQYQRKNLLHCMAVKMDDSGKPIGEPVELDTTQISILANNKIYTAISSEDKQKIMLFKIQTRYQKISMTTILFDNRLNLIKKSREVKEYNDRRENYGNFSVANDGTFVFTYEKQAFNRENSNEFSLVTKAPQEDEFVYHNIETDKKYVDEINLKIDNLNNRYILNTFFYKRYRGSIEGLFTYIWDNTKGIASAAEFTELYDSLRYEAKKDGQLRFAFDNFLIRQVIVKRDGGFILSAEDFSSSTRGNSNPYNRWDYLNNPSSFYSNSYYYYSPYYGYYRPSSSFNNQSTRYYADNIVVFSINKDGKKEWNKVIHKEQFDDDDDNFLSFSTMNSGGEIHYLFNNDKRNQIISDQSLSPDGSIKRNPTLKSRERGYEFMPRLSKQVGANQIIVPCAYRGFICFAKIDF